MGELGTMVEYLVEYILVAIITAITPKLITWFFEKFSATTIKENYYRRVTFSVVYILSR